MLRCYSGTSEIYKMNLLDFSFQGVKRTVEEIENRKIHLGELCTAHKEENVRLSQAFTGFLEKQNEVKSIIWQFIFYVIYIVYDQILTIIVYSYYFYLQLFSWLVSIAEAFLQGHQDMGSVLAMAKDFLELHNQLLDDLQVSCILCFC